LAYPRGCITIASDNGRMTEGIGWSRL